MSDPRLLILVELVDNQVNVRLGTKHEALLSLALRKAQLTVDNVLLEPMFQPPPQSSVIEIPQTILEKI